jgi:hypothetical protein
MGAGTFRFQRIHHRRHHRFGLDALLLVLPEQRLEQRELPGISLERRGRERHPGFRQIGDPFIPDRSPDRAGLDQAHRDPSLRQLEPEPIVERGHRVLRGAVRRHHRGHRPAGDGADVDDPASSRPYQREKCLSDGQQPEHVDLELPPHFLERDVLQRPAHGDAGVVDQAGDPGGTGRLGHRPRRRGDLFGVGDVEQNPPKRGGRPGGETGPILGTADPGKDRVAAAVEREGARLPDTGGCPGDDNDWQHWREK